MLVVGLSIVLNPIQAAGQGMNTPILSDFDVFDADIRDVMRSLAELGDVNVLMDPAVKGPVTIRLKHGMTVKEAIELVSQTNGYSYRWIPNSRTAIIGNEKSFQNFEISQTKIYQLSYAKCEQVANALLVIIPKEKIGMDSRTNQLTIKASILELQNIDELITRLDRQMPQINIEARIEEITKSASTDLGLVYTYSENYTDNWLLNFQTTTTARLHALEEKNLARLIANPNISTTDSQEGRVFIGKKYPIITTTTNNNSTETTITYVEFGTSLSVTPRINENGVVTVTVKAFVSTDTEWRTTTAGSVPVISTREASSVVRLRDGETFVLSGLNMKKSSITEANVPGLSKIPLLGRIFGNKVDKPNDDTEVCIFITPRIIGGSSQGTNSVVGQGKSQDISKSQNVSLTLETTPATNDKDKTTTVVTTNQADNTTAPVGSDTQATQNPIPVVINGPAKDENKDTKVEEPKSATDTAAMNSQDLTKIQANTPTELIETKKDDALPVLPNENQPKIGGTNLVEQKIPIVGLKVTIKVQAGESLTGIAKQYGVTVESIVDENKLSKNSTLKAKQNLIVPIPKDHLYEVKPKETLWRIAKRYGTTVELLKKINNITDISKIGSGSIIVIPTNVDNIADKTV